MAAELGSIPLKSRRAIEAELAARIYFAALPRLGEAAALEILNAAMDEAAREAGRAFSAQAPGGVPSLEHFSGVLRLWQAGGALDIEDVRNTPDRLEFRVTRCGYMEMYAEMGLPKPLHATLSCRRDAAFAEGYSPKLALERPATISEGSPACLFVFRWKD
ncbi:MAG: L-2-amino-thiazoline-4-carboxylic acid hydrolase [Desulfovibrio sp.]|jgi:hypothetical protein|nr:L-2-amino-thiazoline-4-carboxylic acid hydrolase [Desulfovibrio sp.]